MTRNKSSCTHSEKDILAAAIIVSVLFSSIINSAFMNMNSSNTKGEISILRDETNKTISWIKDNSEPSNYLICKVETDTSVAFIKLEYGENITNLMLSEQLNISIFDVPAELSCTTTHFLKGTNISTERFFK